MKRCRPDERVTIRRLHLVPRRINTLEKARLEEVPGICPGTAEGSL